MRVQKAFNVLLIIVMLLASFSASQGSASAKSTDEESLDLMETFNVLANMGAESLGLTQIEGDLGIATEGAEVVGDWEVGGEIHLGPDSLAKAALDEASTYYDLLSEKACDTTVVGEDETLTTIVLTPGVTCFEGDTVFPEEIYVEAGVDGGAEYLVRVKGSAEFPPNSIVTLADPNQVDAITWQIEGAVTIGEQSQLMGTVLSKADIRLGARAEVVGRLISLEGAVFANENKVSFQVEQVIEPTPDPTEEPTPEPTIEPTPEPTPEPTEEPTPDPTIEPTPEPTEEPTPAPTEETTPEHLIDVIIPTSGEIVKDHYIVVLKPEHEVRANKEVIESALNAHGGSIVYTYDFKYNGYLAILSPEALAYVRSDPDVEYVEAVSLQEGQTLDVEIVNPYFSVKHDILDDGSETSVAMINGPSEPPSGRTAVEAVLPLAGVISSFPSYDWVFGCSAVSGAMIAGYYDRNGYPNMYTGPTAGGVMPLTDTSWPTWSDGYTTYPSNPLIASRNGLDGRTIRGSIDDYWIQYGSDSPDPYITGGWTQHSWGTAIGDYMKTSQSAYGNTDGSTHFHYYLSGAKWYCDGLPSDDGTRGRKEFYEARGYSVSTCYFQPTDNFISGGFTLQEFKNEIDAGRPVLVNVTGHTMVGYGYNGSTIYIRDTWDSNPSNVYTMPWGGSYEGMQMWGVSIVNLVPAVSNTPTPLTPSGYIYQKKPTFTWTKVPNATSYSIQVYVSSGLVISKIVYPSACGTTQCSAVIGPLPYVSQYFWRASAYMGGWGPWSEYKYFTRLEPVMTLVWPKGTITTPNPYFQWKPVAGGTNYYIEVYKGSALYAYKTVTNTSCNSTICSVLFTTSFTDGSYIWRVKSYTEGSWNSFSSYAYFTKTGPLPTPIGPTGTIYQKYPTFTWTKVPGASNYAIQVYVTSSLVIHSVIPASACGTSQCSAVIGPLPYVSHYFWRASAYTGGWGTWSGYKYFTRLDPIPTLVWPFGAILVTDPYFQWKPLTGATHYNIELYNINGLYTIATVTSGNCSSTVCSVKLSNYLPLGNYYWRVKSYTEGSWNAFSSFMYFSRPGFQNPGFEQGPVGWDRFSSNGWELIWEEQNGPVDAHGGSWLAWLGGDLDEDSNINQTIAISSAAPYLHFWYYALSEDLCNFDYFYVYVNGNEIFRYNLCVSNNTNGWIEMALNLSGYVGSYKTVEFVVDTDSVYVSSIFLDDISMTTSAKTSRIIPNQPVFNPEDAVKRK